MLLFPERQIGGTWETSENNNVLSEIRKHLIDRYIQFILKGVRKGKRLIGNPKFTWIVVVENSYDINTVVPPYPLIQYPRFNAARKKNLN
jgi:hypothetical protein